jgi:hypothetical protein
MGNAQLVRHHHCPEKDGPIKAFSLSKLPMSCRAVSRSPTPFLTRLVSQSQPHRKRAGGDREGFFLASVTQFA